MDFLKPLFNTELNSEGNIAIGGSLFERSRILNELDPEAYAIYFTEWLEERKSRLIEKANLILAQYGNDHRFGQLKKSFQFGQLRPFIGAGMSISSGYPAWTTFLYQLCVESHIVKDDLEKLILMGDFEQAAQMLYDDLGANLFNEYLQSVYSKGNDIVGPILYLPVLFPNCSIITTNFDDILDRLYIKEGKTGFDIVMSGAALDEVLRLLTDGSRLLIKLHGNCRIIRDRVLLKSEYDTHYANKGIVKKFFNGVLFGSSFLFIGCSLSIDRTIKTMIEIVKENGAHTLPRHYTFLPLRKEDDRIDRSKKLAEANIFPIWYPDNEHDESIEALLIKLKEDY